MLDVEIVYTSHLFKYIVEEHRVRKSTTEYLAIRLLEMLNTHTCVIIVD